MSKPAIWLALAVAAIAGGCSVFANSSSNANPAASLSPISIQNVRLVAREEQNPPPGQPEQIDRDIGFADLFLRIENPHQADIQLVIQRIEIRNVLTGCLYIVRSSPQTILLRPLENAEVDIHLTNKSGYADWGKVKAAIFYQSNDVVKMVESPAVDIQRF